MAFTNSTQNLHLPQWLADDKPTWLTDMNGAFSTIDSAITEDRGNAASLSEKVTQQGITIASNTEAIHNNATGLVAANNAISGLSSEIDNIEKITISNIPTPTELTNLTVNSWSVTKTTLGGKIVIYSGRCVLHKDEGVVGETFLFFDDLVISHQYPAFQIFAFNATTMLIAPVYISNLNNKMRLSIASSFSGNATVSIGNIVYI